MRIVTRPDFDGLVCAVLLFEAENITEPVKWVEPHEIQKKLVDIKDGDIMANLPYDERCSMWFDHHYSNMIDKTFEGSFGIAPSAAGVVVATGDSPLRVRRTCVRSRLSFLEQLTNSHFL